MIKKLCYALIIFILASCRDKDCYSGSGKSTELKIDAFITSPRAVSKSTFIENDAIGIYLVSYVDGSPGTPGDIRNPLNREYIFNGTEWVAVSGDEIFLNETLNDLYAYYPYDPELSTVDGKLNVGSYPYKVPADQSISGPDIDFLWGKVEGLSLTNNRANISFKHLLSRIVVNLYFNDGDQSEVSDVLIHNFETSCSIDLRTGTIIPVGTVVTIKPYLRETPATGYDFSYECIVIPGVLTDDTPLVSLIYNGERLLFTITEELELLPGATYTLNLLIGSAQPEVVSAYDDNHFLTGISYEYK